MKIVFILSLLLISCTHRKYQFAQIDHDKFIFDHHHPVVKESKIHGKLLETKMHNKSFCSDQFLFFNNAAKEVEQLSIEYMKRKCLKQGLSIDNQLSYTWWTIILYSRSCISIKFKC